MTKQYPHLEELKAMILKAYEIKLKVKQEDTIEHFIFYKKLELAMIGMIRCLGLNNNGEVAIQVKANLVALFVLSSEYPAHIVFIDQFVTNSDLEAAIQKQEATLQ